MILEHSMLTLLSVQESRYLASRARQCGTVKHVPSFSREIVEINRVRKSGDTEVLFRPNDLISGKDSADFIVELGFSLLTPNLVTYIDNIGLSNVAAECANIQLSSSLNDLYR